VQCPPWAFAIRHSAWIRHSSFVILSLLSLAAHAAGGGSVDVEAVLAPCPAPAIHEGRAAPYKRLLEEHVRQFLDRQPYAPLLMVLGHSGIVEVFSQSSDAVTALSKTYPHLPLDLRPKVKEYLKNEIAAHPPFDPETCFYEPWQGRRRESFVAVERLKAKAPPPLGLASLYGLWLFAEKTGSHDFVASLWDKIRPTLAAKPAAGFAIDPVKGHWAMNPVVLGLVGYVRLAERAGDKAAASQARVRLGAALEQLQSYWSDRPVFPEMKYFGGVTPATGEALVIFGSRVARADAPNAFSLAGLAHLEGELARFLSAAPLKANVLKLLTAIDHVGPSWYVTTAEPYVLHTDNAQDVPDDVPGILFAKAFIERVRFDDLARYVDLPLCEGDFFYIHRLVTVIERSGEPGLSK